MAGPPHSNTRSKDQGDKKMRRKPEQFANDVMVSCFLLGYYQGAHDTHRFIVQGNCLDNTKERLITTVQSAGADRRYHNFSTDSSGDIMEIMQRVFIEELTEIPEIEYIYSVQDNDIVRVWSIINNHNKAIKKSIYDREYNILDKLPVISFDFHVLVREDRPVNEMAPTGAKLIFRRN